MTAPQVPADRGAASVLVIAAGFLVLVGAVAAAGLVTGATLHTRVDATADLVAIAAAGRLLSDPDPCAEAADVAAANDAELTGCSLEGAVVTVTVAVPTPPLWRRLLGRATVQGSSRAELVVDQA